MRRKTRAIYILALIIAVALIIFLVLYALRQNINLFFTPSELQRSKITSQARIRLGGMVKKNSVLHGEDLNINFIVTDFKQEITLHYKGVLPDLFREGQGVVALGRLSPNNVFIADQILAKHDENYMAPEITPLAKGADSRSESGDVNGGGAKRGSTNAT